MVDGIGGAVKISGTQVKHFLFSGGEVHCRVVDDFSFSNTLICTDYSANGLMAILQHVEVFRRHSVVYSLFYPYLPYSRQDRVIEPLEPFSLKVFANLINAQNFASVITLDPHSDVAGALIERLEPINQWTLAGKILPKELFDDQNVLFVSPDAGAYKKLSKLITDDYRIVIGTKVRGPKGEILRTEVLSHVPLADRTCVIVDDICDGGRTFVELAKVLRAKGAARVILYITHGIFSKGFGVFDGLIDVIYTTNSFRHEPVPSFVHVTEVF